MTRGAKAEGMVDTVTVTRGPKQRGWWREMGTREVSQGLSRGRYQVLEPRNQDQILANIKDPGETVPVS